jgi:23S rRNA (guanosine2251-2'-O)-methyltransferase
VELIEGRQPVREALRAGRTIHRLLIAEGAEPKGVLAEILRRARESGIRVDRVPRDAIDARAQSHAHQGVLAEAAPYKTRSWREGVRKARDESRKPILLALDGVEDPQNAGALLRSAEVFGVDAVLLPKRRAAPLTPAVEKASAGAIEHLVIDVVSNLERALAECKEEGMWIVALASEGEQTIDTCDLLEEPVVLVIGSEGAGVSKLIRTRADMVVRIPTSGRIESLNASVAGAICLWEASRRRFRVTAR